MIEASAIGAGFEVLQSPQTRLETSDDINDVPADEVAQTEPQEPTDRAVLKQLRDRLEDYFGLEGMDLADTPKALDELISKVLDLREVHNSLYTSQGGWIYQGDSEDKLETLTCPVIIQPMMLKEIIDHRDLLGSKLDELRDKFTKLEADYVDALTKYINTHMQDDELPPEISDPVMLPTVTTPVWYDQSTVPINKLLEFDGGVAITDTLTLDLSRDAYARQALSRYVALTRVDNPKYADALQERYLN